MFKECICQEMLGIICVLYIVLRVEKEERENYNTEFIEVEKALLSFFRGLATMLGVY